jgi:hypothetical protein
MQKQFKLMNPSTQKFTKPDLAKFQNSWDQRPHIVSLGAEKNFREFMLELDKARTTPPDTEYFERLIAKAILFRTTEKVVSAQHLGGYRANVVTYTIAKLVRCTSHRLDLAQIWRNQALTEATMDALEALCLPIHKIIVNPSGQVRHIGEWCKKLDCWKRVEELEWTVPVALEKELVTLRSSGAGATDAVTGPEALDMSPEERVIIAKVLETSAEDWLRLSNWAKETNNLKPWQRGIAFSLGRLASQGRSPSVKQARQGMILREEAERLGFR